MNLLKRIADAGQLRRALFVCDRDELRIQGIGALQAVFGADAAPVSSGNPQKNARILIATYQTLDVDTDDADANFLLANYPENYFSHIVIDECHRSAWGKWSQVLTRNPGAVQIGLTATPRTLTVTEKTKEALADAQVNADNLALLRRPGLRVRHEPGHRGRLPGRLRDREAGGLPGRRARLRRDHRRGPATTSPASSSSTPSPASPSTWTRCASTTAPRASRRCCCMPERVAEMCADLFAHLVATGGPEQKTIIFCARDHHADRVAAELNNLYAAWCETQRLQARRALRLQVHGQRRRRRVHRRPQGRLALALHRHHRRPADAPAWTCRRCATSSSSSTCARRSPSTRWSAAAPASTLRPASSCSASTTTPTPRGSSARTSRRSTGSRGSRA